MNSKKAETKDRLNVTLSDKHKADLEAVSKSFKISKSAVIEILLACFFATEEEKKEAEKRVEALKVLLR